MTLTDSLRRVTERSEIVALLENLSPEHRAMTLKETCQSMDLSLTLLIITQQNDEALQLMSSLMLLEDHLLVVERELIHV